MAHLCEDLFQRENTYLVPIITILVTEFQQDLFNTNVLRVLGLFNSRMHLVSMHEAVLEASEEERTLFEKEIPFVARMMIPRWKRLLYEPAAGVLFTQ